jgi:hypothetical protein
MEEIASDIAVADCVTEYTQSDTAIQWKRFPISETNCPDHSRA